MQNHNILGRWGSSALLAVFIAPSGVLGAETVELRAKFPPGRAWYVELGSKSTQAISGPMFPGGKMESKTNQTMGVIEKVESSSKDGAKIVMTFDRYGMSISSLTMGNMSYDSDRPSEDESSYLEQMFSPFIGMPMTMVLDGQNKITSFTGMTAILEKVEEKAQGNPLFPQMRAGLNDDVATQTWARSRFSLLPDRKVKVGETWTVRREEKQPPLGTTLNEAECKLDRIGELNGRRAAFVSYKGTITPENKVKKGESDGAEGQGGIEEGSFSGTFAFDLQHGQIIEQNQETHMKAKISPGGGEPLSIDVNSKSTTLVKSLAEREKEKKDNLRKAEKAEKKTEKKQ